MRRFMYAIVAISLLGCSAPSEAMTICEAAESGSLVDGAALRLEAIYSSNGRVSFFRDNNCPDVNIGIAFSESDHSVRTFRQREFSDMDSIGTLRRYRLNVSGTYRSIFSSVSENVLVVDQIHAVERLE